MASNHLLLSAAVLLSFLAIASAFGDECQPGWGIPYSTLDDCRTYVISRTCNVGPSVPLAAIKERCCRELADMLGYCRCEALRVIMDGVVTSDGSVVEGLKGLPGCPRERQRGFAATLTTPEECNLQTINAGTSCYFLTGGQVPKY